MSSTKDFEPVRLVELHTSQRRLNLDATCAVCTGVFFCLLYRATASDIIRAFDHEPEVVTAGTSFLQMIALGWLFSGPMLPLGSAMNGAGDTKPPMIAAFLANWAVKLPLCYVLALPLGWGINGVWMGMFISIAFESFLMFAWYWRGTWKTKRV